MKRKDTKNILLTITSGTQVVAMLVVPVIVCLLIGLWLDKTVHTTPLFLILGVILGFSSSIWSTYKLFTKKTH